MADAGSSEACNSFCHRCFVCLQRAVGRQFDDLQRQSDALGLLVQQLYGDAVHGRALGFTVDGGQQSCDLVLVFLEGAIEGEGRVFSSTPVEESRDFGRHVVTNLLGQTY